MIPRWSLFGAICAALLAVGCFDTVDGGSGSGTGNSLTATLRLEGGEPAASVPVRLRTQGYLQAPPNPYLGKVSAADSIDGMTDAGGVFRIASLPPGDYVLEANDAQSGITFKFSHAAKEKEVLADTLRPLGSISGTILATGEIFGSAYIQVSGLQRLVPINPENGSFHLEDLPPGEYSLRSTLAPDDSALQAALALVTVTSGHTTVVPPIHLKEPYPNWKYTATVTLNTGATGAAISDDLTGFPMLVRLGKDDFAFTQASVDGSDIRFSKADGAPLRYEIDRWDADSLKAEIWVAMDTVYGNSETQTLRMFWGNPGAPDKSAGAAVFDTAGGFQAVWHLREDQAGTGHADVYRDATGNGYHGLDSVSSIGKEGLIAQGQQFNGISDYIHVPHHVANLCSQSNSISLWFRIDGPAGAMLGQYDGDGIWSTGESDFYFAERDTVRLDGSSTCRDHFDRPGQCADGNTPAFVGFSRNYLATYQEPSLGAWHHLAMTWNGPYTGKFYLDGAPTTIDKNSLADGPDSAGFDIYLGRPNGLESLNYFKGWMDEVVISNVTRSADWIRLAFESQRPGSKVIRISKP